MEMESELRRRDTKTTVEDDTSSDTLSSSSLNDDYNGYLKKDMRYSYGKTPDGKGKSETTDNFDSIVEQLTRRSFVIFSLSSSTYA